jgi:hypothetical protein
VCNERGRLSLKKRCRIVCRQRRRQQAAEATTAGKEAAQAGRDEADATIALARQAREDRELAW